MTRNNIRRLGLVFALLFTITILFGCNADNNEGKITNEEAEGNEATEEPNTEAQNIEEKAEMVEMIIEAEDSTLTALKVEKSLDGFTGTGYVTGFTNDTGTVTFQVDIKKTGLYDLSLGYATPHGEKRANLLLNGQGQGEVLLSDVDGFAVASAGKMLLSKGTNTIALEKGWGWYAIDYISIEPAEENGAHEVEKTLINPNATEEAKSLFSYLVDHYGKQILSGQQDNHEVAYVLEHTGKKPAVLGLDLMDYTPSRAERGTSSNDINHALNWWDEGGIVTFAWHWNAPKDLIDVPGKEWWRGFYTEATTFDLEKALADKESEDFKLLLRDIDVISGHLQKLEDANVPVLWRPLHEAEGGWFWWGAKGPDATKELWKIMYDRMTNVHELNNLIWVWNSVAEDWYPGDGYVDIISYDSYPGPHNYTPVSNYFEQSMNTVDDKKLIALSENGPIPDPDLLTEYQANWSWFCTWNGEILRDHNSIEHLKKVYNHDYVVTLDELPDLKSYK